MWGRRHPPTRWPGLLLGVSALFALLSGPAPAAAPVDPFYQGLLRAGVEAHAQGRHQEAIQTLRLACFGLLEAPDLLAEGLTHLALAQAALSDETAFSSTFHRLDEVEERLNGYTQAALAPELRQNFEAQVERLIPYDSLRKSTAFRHVAKRQLLARLTSLPSAEQEDQLAFWAAAEPQDPAWNWLLAEQRLATGQPEAALEAATAGLAVAPTDPHGRCLRSLAQIGLGRCSEAVSELSACAAYRLSPALAESAIRCWIARAGWSQATAFLAQLPPDVQQSSPFKRLARELRQGAKIAPSPPPPPAAELLPPAPLPTEDAIAAEPPTPSVPAPDPAPATSAPPPGREPAALEEAQRLLAAESFEEVKRGMELARGIADAAPHNREAQLLTAQFAVRLRRWEEAVFYFERSGNLDLDAPQLLFFYAVALYETGESARAAELLRWCQDRIQKTLFVKTYIDKILGQK